MDEQAPSPVRRRWPRRVTLLLLLMLGLFGLGLIVLTSPIGHRLIADRIAHFAPVSGLRMDVGRIEGSLFGEAVLHDVTLSDPSGPFLRVPEVELDWRH